MRGKNANILFLVRQRLEIISTTTSIGLYGHYNLKVVFACILCVTESNAHIVAYTKLCVISPAGYHTHAHKLISNRTQGATGECVSSHTITCIYSITAFHALT